MKMLDEIRSIIYNNSVKLHHTVNGLKRLRKTVSKDIPPEDLHLSMVDYMMDNGLWDWVDSVNLDKLTSLDFESAYWAVISLKDIYENKLIFQEET